MSSGSAMALMATGVQDALFTSDADGADGGAGSSVTFFRQSTELSTRFQSEHYTYQANSSIAWGRKIQFQIGRVGDLLAHCYVRLVLPALYSSDTGDNLTVLPEGDVADPTKDYAPYYQWVSMVGYNAIQEVQLIVGSSVVSKFTKYVMLIIHELMIPAGRAGGLDMMVGWTESKDGEFSLSNTKSHTVYVPLLGLFNSEYSTSLPLVSLQYHPVEITVQLAKFEDVVTLPDDANMMVTLSPIPPVAREIVDVTLLGELILLTNAERRILSHSQQSINIWQFQEEIDSVPKDTETYKMKLGFNHPITFLVWFLSHDLDRQTVDGSSNFNTKDSFRRDPLMFGGTYGKNPVVNSTLTLNNHERFNHDGTFTSLVMPFERFSNVPDVRRGLNVYSFALTPEDNSLSSGSINASRVDALNLTVKIDKHFYAKDGASSGATLNVVTKNLNSVTVISGMMGLRFAN